MSGDLPPFPDDGSLTCVKCHDRMTPRLEVDLFMGGSSDVLWWRCSCGWSARTQAADVSMHES